jgi:hypothetical protein
MNLAHLYAAETGPSTVQVTNDTALPADGRPGRQNGLKIPNPETHSRVDERTLAYAVADWLDGGDFAPIGDRLRDLEAQYDAHDSDATARLRTEIKDAWEALDKVDRP